MELVVAGWRDEVVGFVVFVLCTSKTESFPSGNGRPPLMSLALTWGRR